MNSYLRQNSEETILRSEGADEDFSDPLVDQIKQIQQSELAARIKQQKLVIERAQQAPVVTVTAQTDQAKIIRAIQDKICKQAEEKEKRSNQLFETLLIKAEEPKPLAQQDRVSSMIEFTASSNTAFMRDQIMMKIQASQKLQQIQKFQQTQPQILSNDQNSAVSQILQKIQQNKASKQAKNINKTENESNFEPIPLKSRIIMKYEEAKPMEDTKLIALTPLIKSRPPSKQSKLTADLLNCSTTKIKELLKVQLVEQVNRKLNEEDEIEEIAQDSHQAKQDNQPLPLPKQVHYNMSGSNNIFVCLDHENTELEEYQKQDDELELQVNQLVIRNEKCIAGFKVIKEGEFMAKHPQLKRMDLFMWGHKLTVHRAMSLSRINCKFSNFVSQMISSNFDPFDRMRILQKEFERVVFRRLLRVVPKLLIRKIIQAKLGQFSEITYLSPSNKEFEELLEDEMAYTRPLNSELNIFLTPNFHQSFSFEGSYDHQVLECKVLYAGIQLGMYLVDEFKFTAQTFEPNQADRIKVVPNYCEFKCFHGVRLQPSAMFDEDDQDIPFMKQWEETFRKRMEADYPSIPLCPFYLRYERINPFDEASPFILGQFDFSHTHPLGLHSIQISDLLSKTLCDNIVPHHFLRYDHLQKESKKQKRSRPKGFKKRWEDQSFPTMESEVNENDDEYRLQFSD